MPTLKAATANNLHPNLENYLVEKITTSQICPFF